MCALVRACLPWVVLAVLPGIWNPSKRDWRKAWYCSKHPAKEESMGEKKGHGAGIHCTETSKEFKGGGFAFATYQLDVGEPAWLLRCYSRV